MQTNIVEWKKDLTKQIIELTELDDNSANLLKAISELTVHQQFIEASDLKLKIKNYQISDDAINRSIEKLLKSGFVTLGIALNTKSKSD